MRQAVITYYFCQEGGWALITDGYGRGEEVKIPKIDYVVSERLL